MIDCLGGGLLLILLIWLAPLVLYGKRIWHAWREPVLKFPVLIIESDDWGPGPPHHAIALGRLADCLARHQDGTGHPALATLGLILSVPDADRITAHGGGAYLDLWLDEAPFAPHLQAVRDGYRRGLFAPQLHGAAHYWPPTLMRAAAEQPEVRAWLTSAASLESEALPSHLQSRWTDASRLPSTALSEEAIRQAVRGEVAAYVRILGETPYVAVPPTFVWTQAVEQAWAASGVRCLITPGRRLEGRDGAGRPTGPRAPLHNGQPSRSGLLYLVRDDYFEPAYGHQAERALSALAIKTAQGRPCLLETHRCNFTGNQAERALAELDRLLTQALACFPELRFAQCAELAEQYGRGGAWLERRFSRRYRVWLVRLQALPRFWKLARLNGLAFLLTAIGGRDEA